MKSFDNKKIEDNLCDSWIDEEFTDDSYDGEYDEIWSDDILPDDDECLSDTEDISPRNYTYEKTKSILEDLNMKHLEKFLREMKLKKINNKNKK